MIYRNALMTPDGTIITSTNQHDYQTHIDANGKHYFVDGGHSYCRSSAHGDERFLILDDTSPHSEIREYFTWTTYGKNGDQSARQVLLKDMDEDHIMAILRQDYYRNTHQELVNELHFRGLSYPEFYI